MRKLIILIVLILLITETNAQKSTFVYGRDFNKILEQTNDPGSNLYFTKLLTRFNANDETLTDHETLALLIGFTDDPAFQPYHYLDTEREIYALNEDRKYEEAIRLADSLLISVPVSQQALIEKSFAFYKLGKADSSARYMWKFQKIMATMASTGDGLTPETAIFALGPADGQNFILKYLSSKLGEMGSSRDKDGNFLDILEALKEDSTGKITSQTMYFHVQHAVKKMFGGEVPDDKKKKGRKNKNPKFKLDKDGRLHIKD